MVRFHILAGVGILAAFLSLCGFSCSGGHSTSSSVAMVKSAPADYYNTMVDNSAAGMVNGQLIISQHIDPSADTRWPDGTKNLNVYIKPYGSMSTADLNSNAALFKAAAARWPYSFQSFYKLPGAPFTFTYGDPTQDSSFKPQITVILGDTSIAPNQGWTDTGALGANRTMSVVTIHLNKSGLNNNDMTHEMGHALGIGGHSSNSQDIMFSQPNDYSQYTGNGNPTNRDLQTLAAIYGKAAPVPMPTPVPSSSHPIAIPTPKIIFPPTTGKSSTP